MEKIYCVAQKKLLCAEYLIFSYLLSRINQDKFQYADKNLDPHFTKTCSQKQSLHRKVKLILRFGELLEPYICVG